MTTVPRPGPPADYAPPRRASPEEAQRINQSGEQRYEYWHGWLYPRGYPPGSHWAMPGGTKAHSRVISPIIRILDEHLEPGPCTVYEGNVELHLANREYYFPDAFVTCTPMGDPTATAEWDAILVVEVLSPRTDTFDRTDKFDAYKLLPSIQEYLLLDSRYMRADLFRHIAGRWLQTTVLADGDLALESIGLTLPLATLYARTGVPRSLAETLSGEEA